MNGYFANIEDLTERNSNFRQVLCSEPHIQSVLMSIRPGEEIGAETHTDTDQIFRIEKGKGRVVIDGAAKNVKSGEGIVAPAGARHNVICIDDKALKNYPIYGPPHHLDKLVQATKAEADSSDEAFDGAATEHQTAKVLA